MMTHFVSMKSNTVRTYAHILYAVSLHIYYIIRYENYMKVLVL